MKNTSRPYYKTDISEYFTTNLALQNLLRRRVKGKSLVTTGIKSSLLKRIQESDIRFIASKFRTLLSENLFLIRSTLEPPTASQLLADNKVVAEIVVDTRRYIMTKLRVREFNIGKSISSSTMNYVMKLFEKSDSKKYFLYCSINNSQAFKTTIFCGSFFSISQQERSASNIFNGYNNKSKAFFPHALDIPGFDNYWVLVVVNFEQNISYILDPQTPANQNFPAHVIEFQRYCVDQLNILLQAATVGQHIPMDCLRYPLNLQLSGILLNNCDSGIYIMTAVDFIYNDVPLFFSCNDMDHFRINFCFSILSSFITGV